MVTFLFWCSRRSKREENCIHDYSPHDLVVCWITFPVSLTAFTAVDSFFTRSGVIILQKINSVNQSINQSINRSINQSINRLINQSINRSNSWTTNQSINQSINQLLAYLLTFALRSCTPYSPEHGWLQTVEKKRNRIKSRVNGCNEWNWLLGGTNRESSMHATVQKNGRNTEGDWKGQWHYSPYGKLIHLHRLILIPYPKIFRLPPRRYKAVIVRVQDQLLTFVQRGTPRTRAQHRHEVGAELRSHPFFSAFPAYEIPQNHCKETQLTQE